MKESFAINVFKQYFNFACAHFLVFENGEREPLHGHNYKVSLRGETKELEKDVVIDFLDIKPLVRKCCDELDHKLLIPEKNLHLTIRSDKNCEDNLVLQTSKGDYFSFPKKDVILLPIENTSVERIAIFLTRKIRKLLKEKFDFQFRKIELEIEETTGQSATFIQETEDTRI